MRRRDREVTELNEIIHILDSGKVLHLGLVDQGKPYIVPMNYGYVMENDKLVFYVHGALEGRKLDIIRNNSDCCVQIECDVQPFSGKVACQYGCSYYSFDGFGTAEIVEAPQEKIKAMSALMKIQTVRILSLMSGWFQLSVSSELSVIIILQSTDHYRQIQ